MPSVKQLREPAYNKSMKRLHRLLALMPHLYERGLLDSSGGNLAVRTSHGVYITPSLAAAQLEWHLTEDDFVLFPGEGDASMARAGRRPGRESRLHRIVLNSRPDWNFSLHTHQWGLMGFCLAKQALPVPEPHSIGFGINRDTEVPCLPQMPLGVQELDALLADVASEHWKGCSHGAVLLGGHGPIFAGAEIESTLSLAERIENLARGQLWRLVGS